MLVVVDEFDSNDNNAIAKWVVANPKYQPSIVSIGNKLSSSLAVVANQVRFIAIINEIASWIGSTPADMGKGSIGGNGIGVGRKNSMISDSNNGITSTRKVGMSSISMSFDTEVGAGDHLEDMVVCFGGLSTIAISPAFFQFNIGVPTSFNANYSHSTLTFSVVQIDQAIKLLSLLSRI